MKIDWKNLSLSMIISIIVAGTSGIILSLTNKLIAVPELPPGKVAYTIAVPGPNFLVRSLPEIIALGLTCILVVTIISYFLLGFLRKSKKKV